MPEALWAALAAPLVPIIGRQRRFRTEMVPLAGGDLGFL
jgi:hypothetical protein